MTPETSRITIDPADRSPGAIPDPPEAGLVVIGVPESGREAYGFVILDLARQWSAAGRRVFVCDACFEAPFLHRAAEVSNVEGLSDAILYGTSFQRIGQRIDSGVHLATAGTLVGDPDAVRGHRRWSTIIPGFGEAGALLLVAVPSGSEGPFTDVAALEIEFSGEPGPERLSIPESDRETDSWIDPATDPDPVILPVEPVDPAEPSAEVVEAALEEKARIEAESTEAAPDPGDDLPERPEDALDREGEPSDPGIDRADDLPEIELPPMDEPREPRRRSRAGRLLLLLSLLLIAVVAAAYFGWIEIPGLAPAGSGPFSTIFGGLLASGRTDA
ncbi:MAG: hypothetical protein RQ745_01305 [Longimicrobiales bacterium]|nr:hypothetical protein [Longimicrobiales bacterium]